MDKISTTEAALENAYATLKLLNGTLETLTSAAVGEISAELCGIESHMRDILKGYMEKLVEFQKNLDFCISENTAALSERMSKLAAYHQTAAYKKRNISGISV